MDAVRIDGPLERPRPWQGEGTRSRIGRLGGGLPASSLLIGAIVSMQCGAALASELFARGGVAGTAFLRCTFAAIVLMSVARPRLRGRNRADLVSLLVFGVLLAGMNTAFYEAIDRLPLGVAVTIEFLGPLTVATIFSRRRRDLLWIALAAGGVAAFAGIPGGGDLDRAGIAFALLGGCLLGHLRAGREAGRTHVGGQRGTGRGDARRRASPWRRSGSHRAACSWSTPCCCCWRAGVGVFSAAIPFALELHALRRLTATSYGVLTSLEPAVAGAAGLVLLGQRPGLPAIVAAVLVVTASIGVTRSASAG